MEFAFVMLALLELIVRYNGVRTIARTKAFACQTSPAHATRVGQQLIVQRSVALEIVKAMAFAMARLVNVHALKDGGVAIAAQRGVKTNFAQGMGYV